MKKNKKAFNFKKLIIIIIIIFLIITAIILYSRYVGTAGLKVKEYKIINSDLPNSYHGLKIAHISDIHYNSIINEKELSNVTDEVNLLKPDIIVFTGDLIDDETDLSNTNINIISKYLNKMKATIGKYAITGNHDYKVKEFNTILDKSNFKLIDNTYDLVFKDSLEPIIISGISTIADKSINVNEKVTTFSDYLKKFSGDESIKTDKVLQPKYSILLIHEPDIVKEIDINNYNLVLAGHSHNGQVRLPFYGAVTTPVGSKTYYKEFYTINNTLLYISSGLGTRQYKFRLFNHPSINFYRLVTK